jgi:hypothetical protein
MSPNAVLLNAALLAMLKPANIERLRAAIEPTAAQSPRRGAG